MNYQQKKEEARQKAIDIQLELSELSLSYEELSVISEYLYKLGKRYGLIKEFKENCLI